MLANATTSCGNFDSFVATFLGSPSLMIGKGQRRQGQRSTCVTSNQRATYGCSRSVRELFRSLTRHYCLDAVVVQT